MGGESACGISRKTRVSARVRTRARRHLGRVAPQHSHRAGSHTDGHARASSSAPDSPKAASFYGFETTAPPRELLKDSAASFPRPRWKPSRCAPGLPACPSAPAVPAPPVPAGSAASPWVPALRCAPDRAIAAPPSLARDRPSHRGFRCVLPRADPLARPLRRLPPSPTPSVSPPRTSSSTPRSSWCSSGRCAPPPPLSARPSRPVPARGGLWPRLQAPGYISVSPRPAPRLRSPRTPPPSREPRPLQPLGPPLIFPPPRPRSPPDPRSATRRCRWSWPPPPSRL